MDKITEIAIKHTVVLDLYLKYIKERIDDLPKDFISDTPFQYKLVKGKPYTFEYWLNEKLNPIKAEKMYGKTTLQNLRNMGFEINLVDEF